MILLDDEIFFFFLWRLHAAANDFDLDYDRKTHPTWHSIIAVSVFEGRRDRADLMEAVKTVMTVKKESNAIILQTP